MKKQTEAFNEKLAQLFHCLVIFKLCAIRIFNVWGGSPRKFDRSIL